MGSQHRGDPTGTRRPRPPGTSVADLLKQTESINLVPVLDELVALHTEDVDRPERNATARRRDTEDRTAVGGADGRPCHDPISFRYHVLGRDVHIWERRSEHRERLLDAGQSLGSAGMSGMLYV